jgi:hypothetical protein
VKQRKQAQIVFRVLLRRGPMRILKLAVKNQRWDLAAHTIVLATARQLDKGREPNAKGKKEKKGRAAGQSKRS